jgi:hypothetical protein
LALETASYVANLVVTNPDGGDQASTLEDHIRLVKASLVRTFPKLDSAVSLSALQVSYVGDLSASVQSQFNALRDGPATANFAVNARFANSASHAEFLGGVSASGFARLGSINTFTAQQRIGATASGVQLGARGADYGGVGCNVNFDSAEGVYKYLANDVASLILFRSDGVQYLHAASGVAAATISFSVVFEATASGFFFRGGNVNQANFAASASQATVAATAISASFATFATTCTSASSAATLAGISPSAAQTASTIAQRDGSGNLYAVNFVQAAGLDNVSVGHVACMTNLDGQWRANTLANLGAYLEARNITGRTGIAKTLSTSTPSGGSNGDVWYRYV